MDESSGDFKQRYWEGLIREIDSLTSSPDQRAETFKSLIADVIPIADNWDIICFCLAFLRSQCPALPAIEPAVRELNKKIFQIHYQLPYEIGLIKKKGDLENGATKA